MQPTIFSLSFRIYITNKFYFVNIYYNVFSIFQSKLFDQVEVEVEVESIMADNISSIFISRNKNLSINCFSFN